MAYAFLRFGATTASALGAGYAYWHSRAQKSRATGAARCCGIVGYIGPRSAPQILMDGIRILQNRGYDSCGISTIGSDNTLVTSKFASCGTTSDCIDRLNTHIQETQCHENHHTGIAHTRWATHGAKTDINAHPHNDYKGCISLVHNGTIENCAFLRKALESKNIPFRSQTDTEVIANLVGLHLHEHPNANLETAVVAAVAQLKGTWGLAVISKNNPNEIVLARNGSPLVVGGADNEVFVASETAALAFYTNKFISLSDGDVFLLNTDGAIRRLAAYHSLHEIALDIPIEVTCAPYPHWTLKEILEQPQSLERALNFGGRVGDQHIKLGGLDNDREMMREIRHLVIIGCGTSLYAGIMGERLMQHLGCFETVCALDSAEIYASTFPRHPGCGVLLLSQSGETLDTIQACQLAEASGVRHRFSIVNAVGSHLARLTGRGVYLNAGREVAVASTKAFSSQVTVLSLVAAWFAQLHVYKTFNCSGFGVLDGLSKSVPFCAVRRLPVLAAIALETRDVCKTIAETVYRNRSIFILGKDLGYPVALEGALKIKEIAYIHAEGFAAGALKHGPFALIDAEDRTPVILICPTTRHSALMWNTAEQVKARGAYVIAIVDTDDTAMKDIADIQICIPCNGPLTALLAVIPLQLLAYELALLRSVPMCNMRIKESCALYLSFVVSHSIRNINPDKPRGLAKTVTVS